MQKLAFTVLLFSERQKINQLFGREWGIIGKIWLYGLKYEFAQSFQDVYSDALPDNGECHAGAFGIVSAGPAACPPGA
jgi:hypothetical protein